MNEKYVVISKKEFRDQYGTNEGKRVLMSFAQKPIWKTFKWIKLQDQAIPNWLDRLNAYYGLKKYANPEEYEILPYEQALKEFEAYKL